MPSAQISWVEEAKAATQKSAMLTWKNPGTGSVIEIAAKISAKISSMVSTKNFFVRYMSRNAAQRGFSDQAMPMLPRATVIWPSPYPSDLYIREAVPPTMRLKGMPSARYRVGTQNKGFLRTLSVSFMERG